MAGFVLQLIHMSVFMLCSYIICPCPETVKWDISNLNVRNWAQLSDEKVIAAYDFTFLHFLLNLEVKNVQLWQADEKKGILAQLWLKWNKRTTTRSFVRNSLLEYYHCVWWNCHQSPLNFQWRVPFQNWVPSMCFYGMYSMSFLHLHVKHFFCSMHARELRRHL